MSAPCLLIIDDEPAIRKLLRAALEGGAGYRVFEADTGESGLAAVATRQPDAVLLDLGLPDLEGFEVLDRLREWSDVPVLMLTVRDDPDEKVAALDSGADDYITKPFHTGELLARLRAVLKRRQTRQQEAQIILGDLEVDFVGHEARLGGDLLNLTPIEYRILAALAKYAGRIVTKSVLIQAVWGENPQNNQDSLRVHLAALRKKLRAGVKAPVILTEPGVGYRLMIPPGTPDQPEA